MHGFRIGLLLFTIVSLGIAAPLASRAAGQAEGDAASVMPFPDGFRGWTHVKSAIVLPAANKAAFAGLHNIYANPPALAGYRTGSFPDDSVIVFDLFDVEEVNGALRPTRRKSLNVMARDRSTQGGWRFEDFRGGDPARRADAQALSVCVDCHLRETQGDGVFSTFME